MNEKMKCETVCDYVTYICACMLVICAKDCLSGCDLNMCT